jgi:hypothetical protein
MSASEGVQSGIKQLPATGCDRSNRRKRCSCVSRVTATHCSINTITHHASRITHHASRITHHASRITHHLCKPKYKVQSPCQLFPLNPKILPQAPVLHEEPAQWRWQT